MCNSKEYFHRKTISKKPTDTLVLCMNFIRNLFVRSWLFMGLRLQVETWAIGRVMVKSPKVPQWKVFVDFPKEQSFCIPYKTSNLMMINKKNCRSYFFVVLKRMSILSPLSIIACVSSTVTSWPNTWNTLGPALVF